MKRMPNKGAMLYMIVVSGALALGLILTSLCGMIPFLPGAIGAAFETLMRSNLLARMLVVAVPLLLIALMVFILRRMLKKKVEPADEGSMSLDEEGSVTVSNEALRSLVRGVVGQIDGLDDYAVSLSGGAENLSVTLTASLKVGAQVPVIADEVRSRVSDTLRETAGIPHTDVTLAVTQIG